MSEPKTATLPPRLRSLRPPLVSLIAALAMVASWAAPAAAGPSVGPTADPGDEVGAATTDDPHLTYRYRVETRGTVQSDPSAFADTVASILGDARGWTLGGSVNLLPTTGSADLNIVLASPAAVDAAHDVCSPDYSCRVGDDVLINDRNWRQATEEWRNHGAPLWQYRQYLINHEVGHWLGFGHWSCPAAGHPAPVMVQQSIDTEGCDPNGWPVDAERQDLGSRLGVPVYDDWVYVDVLRSNTHVDQIHALTEADIARGHQGYYYPDRPVSRAEMASFLARAYELSADAPPPFHDVSQENTHYWQIAAVAEADIARGHEGYYYPDQPVSRAEMASFIARAEGLATSEPPPFHDVSPDDTHYWQIAALAEADIARGHEGYYYPDQPVSRAEMASFLVRALGL
jgi:hypothetical protein